MQTDPGATTPTPRSEVEILRERNAELEQHLQECTARVETSVNELQSFTYAVSHDFRAPLRGITGFTRVLIEEHGARLDPEGRRMLGLIRDEARRMSQLIDDLVVFSRVGRQTPDLAEIDMTELARSAFQHIAEAEPARAPLLELGPLPPARADRTMVRQVFANLLGNAVKFTRRHSDPRIEVTGWNEDDWNTYCVADNGVGFDQRYAPKLFGVFQRLHSQGQFEGSGVGLAVVQRIVQRHGGKAWAEGKVNAGARFYVTFPPTK